MAGREARALPVEAVGPASAWGLLIIAVGSLAVFLLANAGAGWYLVRRTTNLGYYLVPLKWNILRAQHQPADCLILGDSSGNQSVMPSVLREELGLRSLNLCTVGATLALDDAWMLQYHLERLGPPKCVLIVRAYDTWAQELTTRNLPFLAKVPLRWGYWERFTPGVRLTAGELWRVLVARYFPLYADDATLREAVKFPWRRPERELALDEWGFMLTRTPRPGAVERDAERLSQFVREQRASRFSLLNQRALQRIIQLARQHRFHVYLADAPIYEGLLEDEAFRAYYGDVRSVLDDCASGSEWVHQILRSPLCFPKEQMQNADHLILPAAERHTATLAAAIRGVQGER